MKDPGTAPNPRERLLRMRVSELLEADERVLSLLIGHGFAPLGNPVLRATLAPTVRLEQALAIGGLDDERRERLLGELEEAVPCR